MAPSNAAGGPGVDADDIIRVASETLTEPKPRNQDLILTGPEVVSYDHIAEVLSMTTGRNVVHKQLSGVELGERLAQARAAGVCRDSRDHG